MRFKLPKFIQLNLGTHSKGNGATRDKWQVFVFWIRISIRTCRYNWIWMRQLIISNRRLKQFQI